MMFDTLSEGNFVASNPCFFCRFNGLSTIVDVLLPRGANPKLRDKNGSIPLHLAARRGNDDIVKVLLDQPEPDVDAKDGAGKTALHLACREGHRKVCQVLLNFGADIKAVSADKMTPLHSAIQNGHTEVARMILNRGEMHFVCQIICTVVEQPF